MSNFGRTRSGAQYQPEYGGFYDLEAGADVLGDVTDVVAPGWGQYVRFGVPAAIAGAGAVYGMFRHSAEQPRAPDRPWERDPRFLNPYREDASLSRLWEGPRDPVSQVTEQIKQSDDCAPGTVCEDFIFDMANDGLRMPEPAVPILDDPLGIGLPSSNVRPAKPVVTARMRAVVGDDQGRERKAKRRNDQGRRSQYREEIGPGFYTRRYSHSRDYFGPSTSKLQQRRRFFI